jgi:ATP-dependent exoDNAse (exonuclease V) beta subunit
LLSGIQLGRRTGAGNSESILLYKELAEQWTAGKETLLNCCASLLAEPAVRELARLSKEFERAVHEEKRKTGILSFKDVSEMAVVTLTENLCLRRYYKNTFRYIMIDEFQDNNALQKNLLFLIAEKADRELPRIPSPEDIEGDKLFFVGDEKQSIYRFRGADVSVFNRLKTDIGGPGGESAALHTNYRSEPALIDFFNTVFQSVMKDAEKPYEASFVPLKSREENPGVQPVVRILYHPYTKEREPGYLSGDEAEAHAIASFVKRAVEEGGLRVSDGSGTRRARYEDIAILLRSTGNQIIYERVLRQKGIPYNAVDVRTLFLEAPVADIYNILQIAVHPEDRVAYAGYLRSPFVGLGDQAFADILSAGTAAFAEPPSCAEAIPPDERTRYKKGEELYRDIELRSRTETITELLFHLWYRCGYRYTILRERRFEGYLEYYDYLIKIASSYDKEAKPLPEFLDFLRKNMGKYERLSDTSILKEEARGVQIMTIHKAKGLEFPIVICANAGNSGRKGSELSAPYYVSEEYDISFNLIKSRATGKRINYFYQLGKEENEAKALAEAKRLLYVTLTRAENHILISGCHTQNNRSENATFLNMVLKALGWDGETSPLETESLKPYIEEIPDITREESFALIEKEQPLDLSSLAEVYKGAGLLGHSFCKTDFSATELCAAGTEPSKAETRELPPLPSDEKGSEGSDAAFGTLCHYIIEKMLCGTYDSDLIPDSIRRFFSEEDYLLFKSDAEILAGRFIESPYGREAMADASRRMEFPFQSRYGTEDEPAYVSGKIDLLYRKDGGIVVIDFKSSRSIVAHEYDIQLSAYRKAVQDIWGVPVRTLLFYLRSGEAVEVNADADIEQLLVKMRRSHD